MIFGVERKAGKAASFTLYKSKGCLFRMSNITVIAIYRYRSCGHLNAWTPLIRSCYNLLATFLLLLFWNAGYSEVKGILWKAVIKIAIHRNESNIPFQRNIISNNFVLSSISGKANVSWCDAYELCSILAPARHQQPRENRRYSTNNRYETYSAIG